MCLHRSKSFYADRWNCTCAACFYFHLCLEKLSGGHKSHSVLLLRAPAHIYTHVHAKERQLSKVTPKRMKMAKNRIEKSNWSIEPSCPAGASPPLGRVTTFSCICWKFPYCFPFAGSRYNRLSLGPRCRQHKHFYYCLLFNPCLKLKWNEGAPCLLACL